MLAFGLAGGIHVVPIIVVGSANCFSMSRIESRCCCSFCCSTAARRGLMRAMSLTTKSMMLRPLARVRIAAAAAAGSLVGT
jgi:hypothetical protein